MRKVFGVLWATKKELSDLVQTGEVVGPIHIQYFGKIYKRHHKDSTEKKAIQVKAVHELFSRAAQAAIKNNYDIFTCSKQDANITEYSIGIGFECEFYSIARTPKTIFRRYFLQTPS